MTFSRLRDHLFWLIAIVALAGAQTADAFAQDASPLPSYCGQNNIHHVLTALDPQDAHSAQFTYRYQWIQTNPNSPTIIFIPGGPGIGSMIDWEKSSDYKKTLGLPDQGFNFMFTDPRLTGCNGLKNTFPDDSITTENLATDIVAAIKDSGVRDYIIYGISYGSYLGTVVASLLKNSDLPKPKALVLVGVMGSKDNSPSSEDAEISYFSKVSSQYSSRVIEKVKNFSQSNFKELGAPADLSADDFTSLMGRSTYTPILESEGKVRHPLVEVLNEFKNDSPHYAQLWEILETEKSFNLVDTSFSVALARLIGCHEIPLTAYDRSKGIDFPSEILGQLATPIKKPNSDYCGSILLDRPFDTAKYAVGVPIVYFEGTSDIATVYEGARYHFKSHPDSDRYFVTIPGGGHEYLGFLFDDCKNSIWESLSGDLNSLRSALPLCKTPTTFEFANRSANKGA